MSRLTELIARAKATDPQLGADLEAEYKALTSRRAFGLNFERHRPEAVELPGRPIRRGDKVRVLPPRGSTKKGDQRLWVVKSIRRETADLYLVDDPDTETSGAMSDLVVVAEFRDPIFPGLISTGKVERGGDKPYHTVINGENFHALKALTYTHRGKVDAIYIDPPYNTGAKDWKYNNDYVDSEDNYRHSKWLAFMERRLRLAQELLNPLDSALIVTIDEKEYLRLGLLLEQVFPEARIQMITVVIAPQGSERGGQFSRVEEYLFFVMLGASEIARLGDSMLDTSTGSGGKPAVWDSLLRRGTEATRSDRESMFYPVYLKRDRTIHSVGDPLGPGVNRKEVEPPEGTTPCWPIRSDGSEGRWQVSPSRLRELLELGYAGAGRLRKDGTAAIRYMKAGAIAKLALAPEDEAVFSPRAVWNRPSHNASVYGSTLLRAFIPGRKFPFPKSLYAVEDALRFLVKGKEDAVIVDFFSGSGTTAHAVMRLNQQDGGRRQAIMVTNNEVAAAEQADLQRLSLRPGDTDWEKWGICDWITKPRVEAVITGKTPNGEPIKGDYKFTDEFPMAEGFEENAEFFTLTYESPIAVGHALAFERIAPLLWIRAGSQGPRIDKLPATGWEVVETYGLLVDLDQATDFVGAVTGTSASLAYIVTDDDRRFEAVSQRLPEGVEPVRLYESYLSNFAFASGD